MHLASALLYVKHLDRMADFYGNALGLKPLTRSDVWAEFDAGGITLGLHAVPAHIAETIPEPFEMREETPIKLIFAVADLDAERARLEALGVTIITRPWGACDGVDPEGNVFQLRSVS